MKNCLFLLLLFFQLSQLLTAQVPYGIDKKPLPKGSNFLKIMPEKCGDFVRSKFKPPRPSFDGECVYSDGKTEIVMLFGLAKDYNETQKTIKVLAMEAETEAVTEKKTVFKRDPSYARFLSPKEAFFAWTRSFYYFSVSCKSGEKNLEKFLEKFPN